MTQILFKSLTQEPLDVRRFSHWTLEKPASYLPKSCSLMVQEALWILAPFACDALTLVLFSMGKHCFPHMGTLFLLLIIKMLIVGLLIQYKRNFIHKRLAEARRGPQRHTGVHRGPLGPHWQSGPGTCLPRSLLAVFHLHIKWSFDLYSNLFGVFTTPNVSRPLFHLKI